MNKKQATAADKLAAEALLIIARGCLAEGLGFGEELVSLHVLHGCGGNELLGWRREEFLAAVKALYQMDLVVLAKADLPQLLSKPEREFSLEHRGALMAFVRVPRPRLGRRRPLAAARGRQL